MKKISGVILLALVMFFAGKGFSAHTEPFVVFKLQTLTTPERDHLIPFPEVGQMIFNLERQKPEVWVCGPQVCWWGVINVR